MLRDWCIAAAFLGAFGCSVENGLHREAAELGQTQQTVLTTSQIYGDDLPPKTVILTWDDGPDESTLELAKYLNAEGVQGTFFINGRRICKTPAEDGSCLEPMDTRRCDNGQSQAPVDNPIYYPESLLHEMVRLGHRIGNHTTDHCSLTAQDNSESFAFELESTQAIVDRVICDGLYVFRAPYGRWDSQAATIAKSSPMLDKLVGPINWDVDGLDWDCYDNGISVERCGDEYLSILNGRADQNGIFLLHDRPEFNVGIDGPLRLAQYLVPRLKAAGYRFSTLDALLNHQSGDAMGCLAPDGTGGSDAATGGSSPTATGGQANGGAGGSAGTTTLPTTGGSAGAESGGAAGVDSGNSVSTGVVRSDAGCHVSPFKGRGSTPSSSLIWLGVVGLLFGARRRRPRA